MTGKQRKRVSNGLGYWLPGTAYPVLLLLGVACLLWIPLRAVINGTREDPFISFPFSIGWYWFAVAGIAFYAAAAWVYEFSPQKVEAQQRKREAEKKKQEAEKEQKEFIETCSRWFWAFKNGTVSEYPTFDSTKYGLMMRPGEVCYLAAQGAILGRGNAHQLEISEGSNAGIDLRGLQIGGRQGRRDSYSAIVYDETHPGTLLITSQRITFVSPPSVFLEVTPSQIVTAAWSGNYVMLRTTMTQDENKNLLAFSLTNRGPSWLYVSAMLRLAQDHSESTPAPDAE
jgi:hypothetical protein